MFRRHPGSIENDVGVVGPEGAFFGVNGDHLKLAGFAIYSFCLLFYHQVFIHHGSRQVGRTAFEHPLGKETGADAVVNNAGLDV
ncbi:hypothetical protein SDC9_184284 [bioreactor metagenome]|uniref:Uncharacterized protein n=1 Tax=bioreactor metagenome TaxID=1076179 RepID=A0A645HMU5_9ZZZZ